MEATVAVATFAGAAFFAAIAFLTGAVFLVAVFGLVGLATADPLASRTGFFAAFSDAAFDLAQRNVWAAAIFCRASVLRVRLGDDLRATFFTPTMSAVAGETAFQASDGRPGFRRMGAAASAKRVLTCCSFAICASIWSIITCISISFSLFENNSCGNQLIFLNSSLGSGSPAV